MGRKPEVFVRDISMPEGQKLQRITRTAKDPVRLRRAIVVLMSAQGQPAVDIALSGVAEHHTGVDVDDQTGDVAAGGPGRGRRAVRLGGVSWISGEVA
jgi:hypothetical protein